jgi:hypothetical protein
MKHEVLKMAGQPAQYYPPQLPLEMQNLASTYQLGAPMAEYRGGFTGRAIGAIVAGMVLVGIFGLAWIGTASDGDSASTLIFAIFTLLSLAFLAWAIISPLQSNSWHVYVFNQGFIFLKGGQPDIFRWADVRAIWQQVTQYYRYGIRTRTTHKYTIERADGHRVVLNDRIKNVGELGNGLSRQISEFMLPHMIAAYNAGNVITFGPLSVSQQGVSNGREMLPWPSIKEIGANRGYVSVRKEGKWLNWSTVAVANIPNFAVFIALTRYILGR